MIHEVKLEKIVPEGRAMGRLNGKALFVLGGLPSETVRVEVGRAKKTWAEGKLLEVVEPSIHRNAPREEHFMSCSPWQGVDYAYQLELKRAMLTELFARPELDLAVEAMIGATEPFGYRNKLEFTVETDEYDDLKLSFHARGSYRDLVSAEGGCVLGSDAMNGAATKLMVVMQTLDLADYIETLTIRESESGKDLVAVLLLRVAVDRDWSQLELSQLTGVGVVTRLTHNSYKAVWSTGKLELTDEVGGVSLTYPWDSFFQVNVPMFEQALTQITRAVPTGSRVVDLYGGAGSIGLPLALTAQSVLGVELIASSVELANHNAKRSGIHNYEAVVAASERMNPDLLKGADVIVVDPPRAGLHMQVIENLIASEAPRIIYLSCNPATQVRDVMYLQGAGYRVGQPTGFDFYPGTLHLESLVILDKS